MQNARDLRQLLRDIDHKGYPSYKKTAGRWSFGDFILSIDHVQGDPFASPSNVSVIVKGTTAAFPQEYYGRADRRIALEDYLLRQFSRELSRSQTDRAGSGKSGLLSTSRPGQEILERTAMSVDAVSGDVTARFEVGFPAHGRTVFVRPLEKILFDVLPEAVEQCLSFRNADKKRLLAVIHLADDVKVLREALFERHLSAFVADGSILARESGVSQRPMKSAVPFVSPKSLSVTVSLPHKGEVTGMGIPEGIFLIVGGGYHGKSTLLSALERGVYDHIAGDGREFVVTRSDAVKIRSEDGRSIRSVDVSLFINDLPNRADTTAFSTEDASGSTSQAAGTVEAMEAGTSLLLVDEDTCATNFMVRDELMRQVVTKDKEPITPFRARMHQLYQKSGISTILVAGSSGSFFGVADTIIQMDEYVPKDVTEEAKAVYARAGSDEEEQGAQSFALPKQKRVAKRIAEWQRPDARVKSKVLAVDAFSIDRENVDLRGLVQIVDREQTAALAAAVKYLGSRGFDGRKTIVEAVDELYSLIGQKGLSVLFGGGTVRLGLAMPRREELLGTLNRWRRLSVAVR